MADQTVHGIIGRERALINALTKMLHDAASHRHDYGPIRETRRGSMFEVSMSVADAPASLWVARVTVEMERIEPVRGG